MRVLVTGHHACIGSLAVPIRTEAGHEVVGLDTFFYEGCDLYSDGVALSELPVTAYAESKVRGDGAEEMLGAYRRAGLTLDDFQGERYTRLKRLRRLIHEGALDADLRRRPAGEAAVVASVDGQERKTDVLRDRVLTYADVDLPDGRLCDRLRAEQDSHFPAAPWRSSTSVQAAGGPVKLGM